MPKPTYLNRSIPTESRLIYEWFAGWRWEHFHTGELIAESLHTFETREECVADAKRHRGAPRERLASVPTTRASNEEKPAQLAA